jgi:hypothetical protein
MLIPNAERALVDIRKLCDYCLNPTHPEGKHKARLFAAALGMTAYDAENLCSELLQVVNDIKLLDVVALTVDLPQDNLWRGQVGTVVDILANGQAFEVEFCDREGRTYESLGLRPDQFMVLHFDPITSPRAPLKVTA